MADMKLFAKSGDDVRFTANQDEMVSGELMLAQWAVKLLLDDANSSFSTGSEGGLLNLAGRSSLDRNTLQIELSEKLTRVEDFMKSEQDGENISDVNKLESLSTREIIVDDPPVQAELRFRVENAAGSSIDASVPVGGD